MRAAGLLPLLPLLLLLGVSSQEDADPTTQGPTTTTVATETIVTTTSAATTQTSPTTSTTATTPKTITTTTEKTTQTTVTTPTAIQSTTPAQSITTADPGKPSSPAAKSPATVLETTPATSGNKAPATTTTAHTSGQDSSSRSADTPKTTPVASSASSQQLSGTTASSGSSGSTSAANPVPTTGSSPPGAAGAATTSSPKQPQENQPLGPSPNTAVSTTVMRTDPPQSSKDCAVSSPPCSTKQPPSSSSSPAQGPTPSITPGSTSVTSPVVSPSLTTSGSKDKVSEAATTAASGADQCTRDAGSASAKPTSASQSPASAQTPAPAPGDQTDQTESCNPELLPHSNLSFPNKLICEHGVELTRPTIHLKEAKTCEKWKSERNDTSFFESFCSTAQHKFDASRDGCTVKLTACKPLSREWAVQVVLHLPLDSEEVLKHLKENDKLEELGIINITSDKMVEDMTINDEFSTPLIITIITLAVSLLLIAAIYGCYQRFSHKKDQNIHPDVPGFDDGHVALIFNQRLTEEMQTMENGYHDNPTLEVMETSSEMQEKKVNLNGELGDSWIVPLDTLMKEDLEEEEDTHL